MNLTGRILCSSQRFLVWSLPEETMRRRHCCGEYYKNASDKQFYKYCVQGTRGAELLWLLKPSLAVAARTACASSSQDRSLTYLHIDIHDLAYLHIICVVIKWKNGNLNAKKKKPPNPKQPKVSTFCGFKRLHSSHSTTAAGTKN